MSTIKDIAKGVKRDSFLMASMPESARNNALQLIANALSENASLIFDANNRDIENGECENLATPLLKRLKFDEGKLHDVIEGMRGLTALPDPLSRTLLKRELDKNLTLEQITCPIGVIGVIFESRPDALVQIASLCLKSGNCAILKGGREAAYTNKVLFDIIYENGLNAGMPKGFLTLIETREDIGELLGCHESIDLLIPRGSNEFVQYIMNNSNIPVMGHSDGICHIYVDKDADISKSIPIIVDAKTQYVAACNAVETLLIHKDIAVDLLPALATALEEAGVKLLGCSRTRETVPCEPADDLAFETEYLDYIISALVVDDMDEAINHINIYGSHHTDCILTENSESAEHFMLLVDSAGVYQNCSTRFADGFRYGFGAEVGISTGKLHARGPVGLDGLVTYKYKLYGNGQIVSDYATGKSQFHFKDI